MRSVPGLMGATLMLTSAMAPAWGQTAPAPGQTDVRGPTREEVERFRPVPGTRGTVPSTGVETDFERAPCPLDDDKYKDISFQLSAVEFSGLRSIAPELLRPAYEGRIGQTLSVKSICDIRDRAATILRRAGYLAAVQVPPQRIENGVVRFDVLVAKLVGLQVRGQAGRSERLIAGYLDKIRAMDVFNVEEAERYLLLARDLPGFDVRLILRPAGTVPGEVIGEVAVVRTPVMVDANVQNLGSRSVGRFGGLARVQFNGLTGLGDRTTLSVFSTLDFEEQQVVQGGHSFRVGNEGLTLTGDITYAWTRPSIDLRLPLRAGTLSSFFEASYPLKRSQAENVNAGFGLNIVNQNVNFGRLPLTRDRLRVLYGRLDYDAFDPRSVASSEGFSVVEPRWRTAGSMELRQGIGLGSSERCRAAQVCLLSRFGGDPTAFLVRGFGLVEYRPQPGLTFSVAPRVQYAPNALLSFEEYSVGNFTVGRGFDPGSLTGDSGLGFQSEVRVGSLLARSTKDLAFQPYGFVDLGVVWNRDIGQRGFEQHLWSAGAGVRAAWGDRARLDLLLAVPLNRPPLQRERDTRLLLSITTKLLPWSR